MKSKRRGSIKRPFVDLCVAAGGSENRMKLSNLCIGPYIGSKCNVFLVITW